MNDKEHYVEIAVKAAKRAAQKVAEKARQENRPLPVYKNGHIEFIVPNASGQGDM